MRKFIIPLAAVLLAGSTASHAQQSRIDEAVTIGPWRIEDVMKGAMFDGCSMMRRANDVGATIVRAADGLTLILDSAKWKLERGKQYPVEMIAGTGKWSGRAVADRDAVSIALTDTAFVEALRKADALEVRGEGSTIAVPLERSALAMERLDSCFERNSTPADSNPFVAPSRRP